MRMETEDARKQPREVLHGRRKQVVRMHRKDAGVMKFIEQTGLSWTAVNTAMRLYEAGGAAALKPDVRGKKPSSGRSLSEEQEAPVRQIICDKRPEQLKMEFALWNRPAVTRLIRREWGLKLSVRAVDNYLRRWGFTPQKPIKRAYEQRPEAVKAWLVEHQEELEVFYLPSYRPELNPDERLNADLKYAIGSRAPARTKSRLKAVATEHMTLLEASPIRVGACLRDPRVKYAAS